MKKTTIAKIFASKKAKTEKKGLFITVQGWGKEEIPVTDGLKLLPITATFTKA